MARLSFVEQERIARNMTDTDILREYEQKGSVLPPGIAIDPSVLLGEMEGRTYVRDAASAAQTSANMQPGTTADQQVGRFVQGMQGAQELLAMGPQQGMGPQGAPQQMGPQMAADGGVIGYQTGGMYGSVIDDPAGQGALAARMGVSREEFARLLQGGLPEEKSGIPYLSGATDMLFGARTLGEALDNPFRVLGTTGLNIGLAGLTGLTGGMAAPLFAGRFAAARGLPALTRAFASPTGGLFTKAAPGGQQLLRMSARGGAGTKVDDLGLMDRLVRGLSGGLGGRGYRQFLSTPAGATALASLGSGRIMPAATRAALDRARNRAAMVAGASALLPGTIGVSAIASALRDDPTLTQEQIDEALAAFEAEAALQQAPEQDAMAAARGFGSALRDDLGEIYTDRIRALTNYQAELREATPEEEALESMFSTRSDAMLDRIDPERDRGELLSMLAGGAARAIDRGGRGGSSVDALVDISDEMRRRGREQRAERQSLEDLAFQLDTVPLERAAFRSRQTTLPERMQAISDLQRDVAQLSAGELGIYGNLLTLAEQNRMARLVDIGDLEGIRRYLMTQITAEKMTPEEADQIFASLGSRVIDANMSGIASLGF
jgi:hypothetical protein